MLQFSVRSVFLTTTAIVAMIVLLMIMLLKYGAITRSDGVGTQLITLTSIPSNTNHIDYVLLHANQPHQLVAKALRSNDNSAVHQYVDLAQVNSLKPKGKEAEISISQQWSTTERTLTKQRLNYTQTYQHLVLNLRSTDGNSKQYTIDLPIFCENTSIDLSKSPQ